eukprot:g677.t1
MLRDTGGEQEDDDRRLGPLRREKKFLKQVTSCLMAAPCEVELYVTQFIIKAIAKDIGMYGLKIVVSRRVSQIAARCGRDVMVVTPAHPKPNMRNLSCMLYLINAHVDLPGGASKKQFADLSTCIASILAQPDPFPWWAKALGIACVGVGYCPVFGGGWIECLLTLVICLFIGLLGFWERLGQRYENLYYIVIGFIATLLPLIYHTFIDKINLMGTSLPIQMWWLPGLEITVAVRHIGFGFSVEGVGMLVNAFCTCFMLGFGMSLGFRTGEASGLNTTAVNLQPTHPVPGFLTPGFLILAAAGAMMIKQARPIMLPVFSIAAMASYYCTTFTTPVLGSFSPLAGGFALYFVASLHNLYSSRPIFPIIFVGSLPIVPGSAALESVFTSMIAAGEQSLDSSAKFLGEMFMISFGIYIGGVLCLFLIGWIRFNQDVLKYFRHKSPAVIVKECSIKCQKFKRDDMTASI